MIFLCVIAAISVCSVPSWLWQTDMQIAGKARMWSGINFLVNGSVACLLLIIVILFIVGDGDIDWMNGPSSKKTKSVS